MRCTQDTGISRQPLSGRATPLQRWVWSSALVASFSDKHNVEAPAAESTGCNSPRTGAVWAGEIARDLAAHMKTNT